MAKYRFKTEQEFRDDNLWDVIARSPDQWNSNREMNHYLGQDVPEEYNMECDAGHGFRYHYDKDYGQYWIFRACDYVQQGDIQYDIY